MSDLCLKNKYMQYVLKKENDPSSVTQYDTQASKLLIGYQYHFSHIRLKINRGHRILVSCGLRYIDTFTEIQLIAL